MYRMYQKIGDSLVETSATVEIDLDSDKENLVEVLASQIESMDYCDHSQVNWRLVGGDIEIYGDVEFTLKEEHESV